MKRMILTLSLFSLVFCVKSQFIEQCYNICDYDEVMATVYNATPEQCNADVEHTAFMFKLDLENPYKHRIIAVSRDLLNKYPKGSRVRLLGTRYDGIYTVMDKMNRRYTNRIDILINQDMPIGKWTGVKIYKIGL